MDVATMGLKEIREALAAKAKRVDEIFDNGRKGVDGISEAEAREARELNGEMGALADRRDALEELEAIGKKGREYSDLYNKPAANGAMRHEGNGSKASDEPQFKSVKQVLAESDDYKRFRDRMGGTVEFDFADTTNFKTLITLSTINNLATREPGIRTSAQEERTVADLMLSSTTDNNQVSYMTETTFTNAAAETSEGSSKPESALAFTETTETIRKIATWVPMTTEALADVQGLESYVRGRLVFMVERREEAELLAGDGSAPNLRGILNRSGIQTQAKGADPTFDAFYKAINKVRTVAFAEPTAIVMHPNDWEPIVLTRTADGIYIIGNPQGEPANRLWGLEVRITTAETEGTGLVGAFRPHAEVVRRMGITVTISTEHSTYFVDNKVAILAEERLGLKVYRPAAFCTVTGI